MSMFIKGENPPKSCYVCDWYNKVQCPVNDGRYYYRVQRHPSCPLTEIKEPHGRLGDLDKLKRKAQKVSTEAWKMKLTAKVETTMNQFIDWLDNAETIVEAE